MKQTIPRDFFYQLHPCRTKMPRNSISICDLSNLSDLFLFSCHPFEYVSLSLVAILVYLPTATVLINLYIIEIGDCPISVDRDSHQMQYRGSAAENVAAGPHVAKLGPERPFRVYL